MKSAKKIPRAKKTPLPGRTVRGSRSGRPIMAILDLLGRRMTLRIVWELRDGELTFRGLQDAAETNPSVLNTRLAELRRAGIVDHAAGRGYILTNRGCKLLDALEPLVEWTQGWAP
jgi:DNA-binding HxlR family transcriptional regulator